MAQVDSNSNEIEVKFYVSSLKKVEELLVIVGAECVRERVFETNYRFDTQDRKLERSNKILRLRRDIDQIVTFKGPSHVVDGVQEREEIEVKVDNLDQVRRFLEMSGFGVILLYEKIRKIYQLGKTFIMMDELPFGSFVEIEGEDPSSIHAVADQLMLNWGTQIPDSYTDIFQKLKEKYKWDFRDLTFAGLKSQFYEIESCGIQIADGDLSPKK